MSRGFFNRLRFFDFVVFVLAAGITVFCAIKIYGKSDSALHFIIQGNREKWVYPSGQSAELDIPGPLGITVIKLSGGKAQVVSSPCINQYCVGSHSIQNRGQWIACLPNAVFVRVEAAEADHAEVDYVAW